MYAIYYPESSYELKDAEAIRTYLLGGKGIVTLQAPSGKYHVCAFNKPRNEEAFPDGTLFIYSQVNKGRWLYCGMLDEALNFRLTRASAWDNDCEITKGARYIINMMKGVIKDTPMKLYHAGVCSVCGRQLKDPDSILMGIGPKCRKKVLA